MSLDFPDWSQNVTPGKFTIGGSAALIISVTGTRRAFSSTPFPCKMVMIEALAGNSGPVYLGASNVTNDNSGTGGLQLPPGAIVAFPINDLSQLYLNGTAGDGVSFMDWV